MSKCKHCNSKFKFMDVLKTINPARIKCSGCEEYIKSSYVAFFLGIAVFGLLSVAFWFSPFSNQQIVGLPMLAFLGILGIVFEYGYFFLLDRAVIKSDLVPETDA